MVSEVAKTIGIGIAIFFVVGFVLGLGTLLLPLVLAYLLGKWYRENME